MSTTARAQSAHSTAVTQTKDIPPSNTTDSREPVRQLAITPDAPRDAHGASAPNARLGSQTLPSTSPLFAAGAEVRVISPPFDGARFDRAKFFDGVRNGPFNGSLTQGQVDGLNTML